MGVTPQRMEGSKMKNKDFAWKCWHFFVIFWPLLCFVFMGIIIGQSDRTVDERIADAGFTVISLIFFAMGMSIRRRLLKEQRTAVALTTAVVVSGGRQKRTGRNPEYYPEFEFQANGVNYRVRSHGGSGSRLVKEGDQVDLYYTPENPKLFYVPALQKYARRCSRLYCGIGILFPLFGLFAPQIRALFSFLP